MQKSREERDLATFGELGRGGQDTLALLSLCLSRTDSGRHCKTLPKAKSSFCSVKRARQPVLGECVSGIITAPFPQRPINPKQGLVSNTSQTSPLGGHAQSGHEEKTHKAIERLSHA